MDWLDIIILAAAGTGLVAFVVLCVVIIRQGRSLARLEERIGPPVPPAAAASLERVRAVTSAAAPAAAQSSVPVAVVPPAGSGDPEPRQTARAAARAAAEASPGTRAPAGTGRAEGGADDEASSGRGLMIAAIVVVLLGLLGAGGWYLFLRDGGGSSPAPAGQATTSTAADSGEVPEDVPPLSNKAAYTVAVLNASGITGAAANRVAPRVQADGYTLGVVDNAAKQDLATSQVQYVKGREEVGWNLAKDLGVTTAVQVDSLAAGRIGTADAVIIVGKDLAK